MLLLLLLLFTHESELNWIEDSPFDQFIAPLLIK